MKARPKLALTLLVAAVLAALTACSSQASTPTPPTPHLGPFDADTRHDHHPDSHSCTRSQLRPPYQPRRLYPAPTSPSIPEPTPIPTPTPMPTPPLYANARTGLLSNLEQASKRPLARSEPPHPRIIL